MKLVKELKGGSLSKTVVMSFDETQWVRKYISIEQNREYGLVRWQSQLRKLQTLRERFPEHVLPVLSAGVDGDYYYFDTPYVSNSHNLYEAIMSGVSYKEIAEQLVKIIKRMADCTLQSAPGSLSVYLHEEVKRPLQRAKKELEDDISYLTLEECVYFKTKLDNAISRFDEIFMRYRNYIVPQSLTHGNFTLENAIWDYDTNKIIMIDFYAETYCDSILGDISQIYQSSQCGYEAVSEYFSTSAPRITHYPYDKIPEQLKDFAKYFENLISSEPWYDTDLVDLFLASQFTRMFQFKVLNNPRLGFLFINHAMNLLGTK